MKITTEMAAHIAALSRLKLSEEEAGRMAGSWNRSSPIWMCWTAWTPAGRSP